MSKTILNGLLVLDFTWMLAGPYATRLLGDFGAEVIKVQTKQTATGAEANETAFFRTYNRNKRGITLDFYYPEAREIAYRLVALSDVVVENFSPRVMSNWGLDYPSLKAANSDLIMVSLSGFGQTGPWKDFVAFGPTVQALSGLTHLTSSSEHALSGLGFSYADLIAGLYAAAAILGALEYRDRTGEGRYIDISEYETTCSLLGPALLNANKANEIPPSRNRPSHFWSAPYGCYRCAGKDRWCVISISDDAEWQALKLVVGRPAWMEEEKFASSAKRMENAEELDNYLEEWTKNRDAEEVLRLLQDAGVPAGIVQNAENLAHDPQLMARNFFLRPEQKNLENTPMDVPPFKFMSHATINTRTAPLLGGDNRYVFMGLLGLRKEEFDSYVERGIIG